MEFLILDFEGHSIVYMICRILYVCLDFSDGTSNVLNQNSCTYLFVSNVFQSIRNHSDSHIDQIRRGHFKHLFRKFFAILVNFLKRKKIMVVDKLAWKKWNSFRHWRPDQKMTTRVLKLKFRKYILRIRELLEINILQGTEWQVLKETIRENI